MSGLATTPLPQETIWSLATGAVPTRALHLVAEVGVADHGRQGPGRHRSRAEGLRLPIVRDDRRHRRRARPSHRAVLDATPSAHGVLFDLPGVVEAAGAGTEHLHLHPGDFFVDPLPRADAYVLMEVLHDWPDNQAIAILRAIRRAASAGATVLLIEGVVAEDEADARVHTLDVIMLAITGGRERTASELDALAADFRLSAVIETAGPMRVIEAVAI